MRTRKKAYPAGSRSLPTPNQPKSNSCWCGLVWCRPGIHANRVRRRGYDSLADCGRGRGRHTINLSRKGLDRPNTSRHALSICNGSLSRVIRSRSSKHEDASPTYIICANFICPPAQEWCGFQSTIVIPNCRTHNLSLCVTWIEAERRGLQGTVHETERAENFFEAEVYSSQAKRDETRHSQSRAGVTRTHKNGYTSGSKREAGTARNKKIYITRLLSR